jgi:transposase
MKYLRFRTGMARPGLKVSLTPNDRKKLMKLLQGAVQPVRIVLRSLILLNINKGANADRISAMIPFSPQAIRKIAHRYQNGGLDSALSEEQRPGRAKFIQYAQRNAFRAMLDDDPPEGHARWTVRLAAEEAVKRKLVPRMGREAIRLLMREHNLKPSKRPTRRERLSRILNNRLKRE